MIRRLFISCFFACGIFFLAWCLLAFFTPKNPPLTSYELSKNSPRLELVVAQDIGIDKGYLQAIDKLVDDAISQGAFPGCQIVAAVDGKVFFRKSYGTHCYNDRAVQDDDIYDLASITKIAGSTLALMRLQTEGKFSLDKTLGFYLPELTANSPLSKLTIREILAHQAGLKPWIPFYKKTLIQGELNPNWYAKENINGNYFPVAEAIFLTPTYRDSIFAQICATPLGQKKYIYSDLGYYFIKEIIEKLSGKTMDAYLYDEIYSKMGLHSTMYNPYIHLSRERIVPTEYDTIFRHQLIHGYVHDPGAAMLGGIGGHAGLFSNATELASLMQLFLNEGSYGDLNLLNARIVQEYTQVQFAGNRRGAGFDKPVLKGGGGPCDQSASFKSFGHSGFTGTLAWADPKNKLVYVFLSNRVYPDAENKKLIAMGTRTKVQKLLNQAIADRKQKKEKL